MLSLHPNNIGPARGTQPEIFCEFFSVLFFFVNNYTEVNYIVLTPVMKLRYSDATWERTHMASQQFTG